MNYKLVLKILGFIAIFIGAAMLLPLPFAWYYGDGDFMPILYSALITLAFGSTALLQRKKNSDIQAKEGFMVVTLGWIIFAGFGSLPYLLSGSIPSFTDAFYETMSGFTTTGATILTDIESLPHGILFWRSLTHWLGGMGIIVLSIAILPFLGVGGMQLFKAEVPGPIADKLKPRVTETAKILWGVYLLLSAIECVLLMIGGMNLFDALCHTFGTMATGGYSTKNTSIAHYSSAYIDYVIIIFMILAGTNFSLHYRWLKGDFKSFLNNWEFKAFISIITVATILIFFDVYGKVFDTVAETIQYVLFQVVAIITTTGYGTADYEQWGLSSQIILYMLMFVGGCAGSTGGGMKVMRILLLVRFAYSEFIRLIHPQAIVSVKLGNNIVDRKTMSNVAGYFVTFSMIAAFSTLLLTFMGIDLVSSLGAVAANINNIGPGLGSVGPTDNYAHFPAVAKWLLSFLMLIGRLELFTVLVLLTPIFWRK